MTTESAKTVVERAAHLEITAETMPDDAREQGLRASYSNATTAAKYKSVVALFVMNDAGVADRSPTWRAARPSNRRG